MLGEKVRMYTMKTLAYSSRGGYMNKVSKKITDEEIKSVYNFIEDYILENHKLCSVSEILKALNLSEKNVEEYLAS